MEKMNAGAMALFIIFGAKAGVSLATLLLMLWPAA